MAMKDDGYSCDYHRAGGYSYPELHCKECMDIYTFYLENKASEGATPEERADAARSLENLGWLRALPARFDTP